MLRAPNHLYLVISGVKTIFRGVPKPRLVKPDAGVMRGIAACCFDSRESHVTLQRSLVKGVVRVMIAFEKMAPPAYRGPHRKQNLR